jgi:alanine racemase
MNRPLLVAETAVPTRPRLTVDLDAVAVNTRLFGRRTPGELMAVVKADGFGHGAAEVARTALVNGATRLGVTSLDEAFALRDAGLVAPVLSWLNPVDADWTSAVARGIDVAVPSRDHLDAVIAHGRGARVHLHLDTGMARDGAAPTAWASLCRAARRAEQRRELTVVGLMGHLACADVPEDPANATGRTRFAWGLQVARGAGLRPAQRHLAATAATLVDPLSHHTMSRIGAGLVGIDPSRTTDLRPALTLTAPIVGLRSVRAGTPVGYGHTWQSSQATRLALLPVGYADGLPSAASGRAEVLISGRRVPVVGRISMDMTVVDLGEVPAELGDLACVFGPGRVGEPTVRDWADAAGVTEHAIVTGLGHRIERVHASAPNGLRGLS